MAEKTQVALCITELDCGGAEKIFCELARSLDSERFETVVYCLRPRNYHQKANFIPFLEKNRIPVIFLDMSGPFSVWRGLGRLKRLLREQRAEIFQSFMFHANFFGRIAARGARVPVVCSGLRVSEKARKSHLRLDRLTAGWVDAWVCVSRSVAEFSEKCGKLPKNRLHVIPNAVTVDETATKTFLQTDSTPISPLFGSFSGKKAVVVGRLTYQKGLDWLLKTAPYWLGGEDSANKEEWGLWLIGQGDFEVDLRRQVELLPAHTAARIHFVGWRPDVSAILAEADLLLLPSRWEGMPNALMEAAAASLPVLATATDGVREILGDDLSQAQTVPFGATDEWLERIRPLLSDSALRHRLGVANRQRVVSEFSVEMMVKRYEELWIQLLGREPRRAACATAQKG